MLSELQINRIKGGYRFPLQKENFPKMPIKRTKTYQQIPLNFGPKMNLK